ncbi:isoprenyl transferase [Bartonella sp. HY329]|uniref:isoprenyl transferase n=1 Tax=unclassified Bartonella TaxID=2645622 RepID=UPI0021C69CF0|nr:MULTISPECIES: isoprenyl transferase [unclassified Bartonella]UXM94044.1 isoprenyl transferase [Bartonella sp. HY329]UXN08366.1 isoprenyl transferase [Bartonella sp. HY328]
MSQPKHIAIIMDGNGRWAKKRQLPRVAGHKAGAEALRKIVDHGNKIGIKWLTFFAFSSENWARPKDEVSHLLSLLKYFIRSDINKLKANNVRVRIIGCRQGLSDDILSLLEDAEKTTAANDGLNFIVAFNYGSRNEITRSVKTIAEQISQGVLKPEEITEALISSHLDTCFMPDPDLIIRTSGEMRLSNFLLWQAAYAELCFVPCFWPDFSSVDFDKAIEAYQKRDRRFGAVSQNDLIL